MQAPVETLDIVHGEVIVKGRAGGPVDDARPDRRGARPEPRRPRGDREPGLSAEGWFYAEHQVYPYGNHLAVVQVDPDTGGVKVLRYVIGYDIGRAINPTLVKGQIAGGFAQGLGGALMEEFTYNERGDPLAVTFADYLMPTVRETPDVEIILARGLSVAAQSARHQGRGRERRQRRRRRHRVGDRRRHRHSRRDHRAAGDAAAAEGDHRREKVIAVVAAAFAALLSPVAPAFAGHSAARHIDFLEVEGSGFADSGATCVADRRQDHALLSRATPSRRRAIPARRSA